MLQNARGTFLSTTRPYCKCWGSPGLAKDFCETLRWFAAKRFMFHPTILERWTHRLWRATVEAWMTFFWDGSWRRGGFKKWRAPPKLFPENSCMFRKKPIIFYRIAKEKVQGDSPCEMGWLAGFLKHRRNHLLGRLCRLQVQFAWLYISASFKTHSVQTLWSWELQQTFKSLIEKGEKCEEKPRKLEMMGHWAIAEFNSKTFGSNLMRTKVKFHPPLAPSWLICTTFASFREI